MRQTLFLLTAFVVMLSCNNTNSRKDPDNSRSSQQSPSENPALTEKQMLIQALKDLQKALATKDKQQIADLFSFPLADTSFPVYLDSSFMEMQMKSGNQVTRSMFLKYFPEIFQQLQFDQFNNLFKNLNLDELNKKNSLTHAFKSNKEPCYRFYNMLVDKNMVLFEYGSNRNEQYADKSKNAEEEDEATGDECEFSISWWFRFDGKKLQFVRQMSAG